MSLFRDTTYAEKNVLNEIKKDTFFVNTINKKIVDKVIHFIFQGRLKEWWLVVFGVIKCAMRFMQNSDITSDDLSIFAQLIIVSVGNEFQNEEKYKEKNKMLHSIRDGAVDILHQINHTPNYQKWLRVTQEGVKKEIHRTSPFGIGATQQTASFFK